MGFCISCLHSIRFCEKKQLVSANFFQKGKRKRAFFKKAARLRKRAAITFCSEPAGRTGENICWSTERYPHFPQGFPQRNGAQTTVYRAPKGAFPEKGRGFPPFPPGFPQGKAQKTVLPFTERLQTGLEPADILGGRHGGKAVLAQVPHVPGAQLIIGLTGDHAPVVPAEGERREIERDPGLFALPLQQGPESGVCRHAPCGGGGGS